MTAIDSAVRAVLVADASVLALVSTRVYPDRVPNNVKLPAISVSLVSEVPDPDIPGFVEARVQVSCWAATTETTVGFREPTNINALVSAVKTAMHVPAVNSSTDRTYGWTTGSTTYTVSDCTLLNSLRYLALPGNVHHVPMDFLIKFREP